MLSKEALLIPTFVWTELELILRRKYKVSREKMTDALYMLLGLKNMVLSKGISEAIELYAHSRLSFTDCLLVYLSQKEESIASFDHELLKYTSNPYWKR